MGFLEDVERAFRAVERFRDQLAQLGKPIEGEERMSTDKDKVHETLLEVAKGKRVGRELKYDRGLKTLRAVGPNECDDGMIDITPEDLTVSC